MINRVLIRIKVVQMLYSYLLTRNEFKIEPAAGPEATIDSRFAYRLYLDLIMFVMELSGQSVRQSSPMIMSTISSDRFLTSSTLAHALGKDDRILAAVSTAIADIPEFDDALAAVYSAIKSSDLYPARPTRTPRELSDDVELWTKIVNTIIRRNEAFVEAARSLPGFTINGFNRAFEMFLTTINSYTDNREALAEAFTNLRYSLNKAYDLYNSLFRLAIALTDLQARRLDAAKNKYMPSDEDLHPDTRFIDNAFIHALETNPGLTEYSRNHAIDWSEDDTTLRRLLNAILESDVYQEYMASPVSSWKADCDLWRELFKKVIFPSDALAEALEAKSVYWNDDLDIMGTFVIKTIKLFAASRHDGADVSLLPQYKDEEDEQFGKILFTDVVEHGEEYRVMIDRFIDSGKWDSERLAFMDIVVMMTAIAELLRFPAIPVPVTLNEYIEIANCYSTPRSGHFINGVLFSIINLLAEEGRLDKPISLKS